MPLDSHSSRVEVATYVSMAQLRDGEITLSSKRYAHLGYVVQLNTHFTFSLLILSLLHVLPFLRYSSSHLFPPIYLILLPFPRLTFLSFPYYYQLIARIDSERLFFLCGYEKQERVEDLYISLSRYVNGIYRIKY